MFYHRRITGIDGENHLEPFVLLVRRKVALRNVDGSLDVILSDGRIRQEVPPEDLRLITRNGPIADNEPEEPEGTMPLWSSRYVIRL